jgi:ribosomal-protein-alanine N-acetyltransferase
MRLRQLDENDAEFVLKHFSDPLVARYLYDEPPLASLDAALELIAFFKDPLGKNRVRWGLERKQDRRLIGTCGFHRWEKSYFRAEMGYDLAPDCWGQGYMGEALRAIVNCAFKCMHLNRIDALVYTGNEPSLRILQRLGFKQEGVLHDYFYQDGKFYDHALLALLRRDWPW